ncbi:MAG TPA: HAD-IIB family hydrolase [Variovorax sp.]|nr:HAD-IIB family hydrolase [Variovorax sp.]
MSSSQRTNEGLQPLASWSLDARRQLIGVFTDIDDTLTTEGEVPDGTVAALKSLRDAGLHVVAITGRPVGWSEPFAARWPIDAIVPENGAMALLPTGEPDANGLRKLARIYQQDEATRTRNHARMQEVLAGIERDIPGAKRAQDSAGRECDIAVDHSEFAQLSDAQIDKVVLAMRVAGMHATVSSIHVNGWFGEHNKLEGAHWIVRQLWNRELAAERHRWAFVGDSTNDALMFHYFEHSVGVANIARFVPHLSDLPSYVTRGERGAGFEEVARAILAAR